MGQKKKKKFQKSLLARMSASPARRHGAGARGSALGAIDLGRVAQGPSGVRGVWTAERGARRKPLGVPGAGLRMQRPSRRGFEHAAAVEVIAVPALNHSVWAVCIMRMCGEEIAVGRLIVSPHDGGGGPRLTLTGLPGNRPSCAGVR